MHIMFHSYFFTLPFSAENTSERIFSNKQNKENQYDLCQICEQQERSKARYLAYQ